MNWTFINPKRLMGIAQHCRLGALVLYVRLEVGAFKSTDVYAARR